MKFTRIALASAAMVAAMVPVLAQAELSYNIGVVSLYKSNGIDQDNRAPKSAIPAVQGGVDYSFGNGFYVGNWNSTGKFGAANVEIDLYGGYTNELADGLSYDVGVARFIYPNEASFNAQEWYASLTYGIATVKYVRGFGNGNKNARLGISIEQALTEKVNLTAGMGFRNKVNNGGAYDYSLGLSYDLGDNLSASATVSGAETSEVGDIGKGRLILGLSKSF